MFSATSRDSKAKAPARQDALAHSRRPQRQECEDTKPDVAPRLKDSNIVFIRAETRRSFYIHVCKMLLHVKNFSTVILSAAGAKSIISLLHVADKLSNFGYSTLTFVKTSTAEGSDGHLSPKLVVSLQKTPDFDKLYTEYREGHAERSAKLNASRAEQPTQAQPEASEVTEEPRSSPDIVRSVQSTGSEKPDCDPCTGLEADQAKWWLNGIAEEELGILEDEDEPVIYI